MKRLTAVVAFTVTAAAVLLSAAPASATYPGKNGWIAFRKVLSPGFHAPYTGYNHAALYLIRPDGTGLRQLTHPRDGVVNTQPDWSPNGRWIAYQRTKKGHPTQIFRIRRNGTDGQNLSRLCGPEFDICESNPAWSPGGRRIAFTRVWRPEEGSEPQVNIFVMRANGTHRVAVTSGPVSLHEDYAPQWSPNGKRLVFERLNNPKSKAAAFTVRLDGTGLRRLTPWWMDAGALPDWSPHGRCIMFFNPTESEVPKTLWLVRPNGEGLHRITTTSGGRFTWWSASFSPSGRRIAAGRSDWAQDGAKADVYVLKKTGEILRNVTQSVRWDSEPDWGPRRK